MVFSRSASVLRSVARRTLSPQVNSRFISRTAPRRATDNSYPHHITGGASDVPWIIGSVGITLPCLYYLFTQGSPSPKHSDSHHKMDTASTSPGPNVQTHPPSQRNGFNHSHEHRTEADDKNAPVASQKEQHGHGTKKTEVADSKDKEPTSTSPTKEEKTAAHETQEQAGDVTENVKETAKEAASEAQEKAADITESVKETASEAKEAVTEKVEEATESKSEDKEEAKDEAKEEKPKSKNPQEIDPGYTAQKTPGHIGTMSGKQEGLSNTDTSHPLLHTERGDAIAKKPEGIHETAKIKGTVDVNRGK
ncbi:hypothetical protein BZA77DRAFT_150051 [Pyronema omphalodes]|nr:hypothetical protein BZA77DRAFT_150051 [Pyronema omphalodes]